MLRHEGSPRVALSVDFQPVLRTAVEVVEGFVGLVREKILQILAVSFFITAITDQEAENIPRFMIMRLKDCQLMEVLPWKCPGGLVEALGSLSIAGSPDLCQGRVGPKVGPVRITTGV